jgi:hypothetical protein
MAVPSSRPHLINRWKSGDLEGKVYLVQWVLRDRTGRVGLAAKRRSKEKGER